MVRQFAEHVATREHSLPRFHLHPTVNRKLHFGKSRQPQIGASMSLAYPLAKAQESQRRQAETMTLKLQYDIITLVGLDPQSVRQLVHGLLLAVAPKIHDFSFHRATCRIGSETIDFDDDFVRLATEHTVVR